MLWNSEELVGALAHTGTAFLDQSRRRLPVGREDPLMPGGPADMRSGALGNRFPLRWGGCPTFTGAVFRLVARDLWISMMVNIFSPKEVQ